MWCFIHLLTCNHHLNDPQLARWNSSSLYGGYHYNAYNLCPRTASTLNVTIPTVLEDIEIINNKVELAMLGERLKEEKKAETGELDVSNLLSNAVNYLTR